MLQHEIGGPRPPSPDRAVPGPVTDLRPPLTAARLAEATAELVADHPLLGHVVQRHGAPPLWPRQPGYATLLRIILEQQVSLDSARAVYRRLLRRTGAISARRISALGIEGLRATGFTRQKAGYCVDLARAITAREVSLTRIGALPDEECRTALLAIRGVGPWSADVYRLFALRRPDVWPHGDIALADAARDVLGLRARPDQDRLTRLARRWAPWRSVAARLLWHHYLSVRGRS